MREMICIICPNGCPMRVEENGGNVTVTGNLCPRGKTFAGAELRAPMRTVCTTVRTIYKEKPVVPVRVSGEIPKEKIFDVMEEVRHVTVDHRMKRGDILIPDVLGLGVDVIITSDILYENLEGVDEDEQ